MHTKNGSVVIGVVLILILIVMAGVAGYIFLSTQKTPTASATVPNSSLYSKGDINQDGKVDELDQYLFKGEMGCKNGDQCWNKVIGKTLSGFNPIYTHDLDLNNDGIIDDKDVPAVK